MPVATILLGVLWLISLLIALAGSVYSCWRLRWRGPPPTPVVEDVDLPPISILKPIKGADPGLEVCLESFFRLDYPRFELIFAVADSDDPAAAVVRALRARYPFVASQLVTTDVPLGANPKINNLAWPLALASYDCTLVSDAFVKVEPDYLRELVPRLRANVQVVSAAVRGEGGTGLGGCLEELHLNAYYLRYMLLARALGITVVFGPCMLFRRSVAEAFGGLASLDDRIAEDFVLGSLIRRHGGSIELSGRTLPYLIGPKSFRTFWQRHLRWCVIRKYNSPPGFWAEPLGYSLPHSLLGAAVGFSLAGSASTALQWGLATLVVWVLMDSAMMWANRSRFRPEIWLLREFLTPVLWAHGALSRHVVWKGVRLNVHGRGLIRRG